MVDFALRKLVVPAIAAGLGLTAMAGYADEAVDAEAQDMQAALEQRIAGIHDRLALTDGQEEAVAPILRAGLEKQMSIMEKHGIDPSALGERPRLGLRAARQLRREMDAVREDTFESLAGVLNPEQIKEYRKIQDESRQEIRSRLLAN